MQQKRHQVRACDHLCDMFKHSQNPFCFSGGNALRHRPSSQSGPAWLKRSVHTWRRWRSMVKCLAPTAVLAPAHGLDWSVSGVLCESAGEGDLRGFLQAASRAVHLPGI